MCADKFGNIYASNRGNFGPGSDTLGSSVAKWDGTKWTVLYGSNTNGSLWGAEQVCMDNNGTLYACTQYDVAKWNGTDWIYLYQGWPYTSQSCYWEMPNAIVTDKNNTLYTGLSHSVFRYAPVAPGTLLAVPETVNDIDCGVKGAATVAVYGGTAPYQYRWSNGATTDTILLTLEGTYSVTVTDHTGITGTASVEICNKCSSMVSGIVFNDVNNNCVMDSGEIGVPNRYVAVNMTSHSAQYSSGSTYDGGWYNVWVKDTGAFTVKVDSPYNICTSYKVCYTGADTGYLAFMGDTALNVNIALQNYIAEPNQTMHVGWTAANPGFTKQYWIMPYYLSVNSVTDSATIVFNYDPNLIYQNAPDPQPVADIANHILSWRVKGSTIPYYTWDWLYHRFIANFMVPAGLSPGYVLQNRFTIEPVATDCDSANNHIYIPQIVTGSFDPNEKDVYPSGNLTDADTVLTYTINFQNTGTAPTNFVIVTDTLSSFLDARSVINLASSAPYSSFQTMGHVLVWTFNPLQLPDSSASKTDSKGFVTFSVKRNTQLADGITIRNSAAIQFDYNANIITNTTSSIIGASSAVKDVEGNISVQAYPNPFTDVSHLVVEGITGKFSFNLFDITGRLQLQVAGLQTNHFDVLRRQVPAGVYLYQLTTANGVCARGKLVAE